MYKQYRKAAIAELRPVTLEEIEKGLHFMEEQRISVSPADIDGGSPKVGDMIARNPCNHDDKWLVAKEYFEQNFVELI